MTVAYTQTGQQGKGITITVRAEPALSGLDYILGGIQHPAITNKKISIQLYGWVIRNFQAAGGMQDPPWQPLATSTQLQKAALGYSPLPLIRTGNLRQSFAPFSDDEVAGVGARASFGVDYAQIHQNGNEHVPARPMLPPAEVAKRFAVTIWNQDLADAKHRAGFP